MTESFEFIPPPPPAPVRPPTPVKVTPRLVRLKATYQDKVMELNLEPVTQDVYGWQALKSKLQASFGIWNISVKYTDDAGDNVNMDSQEEYEEAIKVAQQLGSLELTVTGDPYNRYVEDLHIKLSKPFSSLVMVEAMDTSPEVSSAESSFVEILHTELSKRPPTQVKYHPYRRTSSSSYYADLARKVGSERQSSSSASKNDYIESFQQKMSQTCGSAASPASGNPYVDMLHQRLSKTGGNSKMPPTLSRSPAPPAPYKPVTTSTARSSSRNEYVESLHAKLQKMGTKGRQPVAPCPGAPPGTEWWVTALEKTSDKIIGEVHRGLEGTVEMLTPSTGSSPFPPPSSSNVIHYNITCDGCNCIIKGVRYKCGNCPDYDLCESCELWSESIHRPDHVFVKIKIPATQAGINRKGKLRPLLKKNLYQFTCHSSDEEEVPEKNREQLRRSHHHRPHHQHRRPHEDHCDVGGLAGGYITRPKDQLKEELKMRKKEEKQRAKMEKKVEKLGSKLAAASVSSPKGAGGETRRQRGHGKYLDCQFITDTCYPDDSLVPANVPFEKGWLVMNSGTKRWRHVKLVHTDGFRPLCSEVDVPELKPGERVELVAKYPPINDSSVDAVKSSWRLVHKESTAFGPLLWLQVRVDRAPLLVYPPTILVPPVATPTLPEQSLTNENLLKSIGFIPTDPAHKEQPSEEEELLTTFDIVERPKDSAHSLSSFGSLTQPAPYSPKDDMDDAASVASDDSDFVVVIPDCFDLDKPLPGFSIRSTSSLNQPTESIKSCDSHTTFKDETVSPKAELPPAPIDSAVTAVGGASPEAARKATFVPERITLKQVKDGRLYRNPITVATGLVNTVTDLVDKRVHFGQKKSTEAPPTGDSSSESDDTFEDAPEAPGPSSVGGDGGATPLQPWGSGQSSDVNQWVKSEDSEDMRRWCHNPDVSHLVPLRWDGPKSPATPMDRLIGMGFADRQLNARLLEKHRNDLTAVLNELLDDRHQAFGGGASDSANV